MHYFLDTCVELGYVFCTDPWNDKSVKVFDDNDYLRVFRIIDFFTKFINKSITNYTYTYKIYNYTK